MNTRKDKTGALAGRLESLSPLKVLQRGYTVTERTADGAVVRNADTLAVGQQITTRFDRGRAVSRVEEIDAGGQADGDT
jgi:exodeoxyribonuclease VII large subunit